MGTYRNPDPVVANTGSAVYEGIQKLTTQVYDFANAERKRKSEIIGKSLAEQQAIDDDINKLGLDSGEGGSVLEKEIYEEAQATKRKIAEQYDLMAKTFATPETIAKSKAEIARLNKYPEQLIGDLSTGKYMVDQYSEAIMKTPGGTGSISFTNDADMLAVVSDMRSGGKNTKMVTGKNGGRFLVTNVDGKESKLNITAITNGIKNNPNYTIFKSVVDDSGTAANFMNAAFGEKPDALNLIGEGILIPDKDFKAADAEYASFQLDEGKARAKVKGLTNSLINDPANYDYLNSVWQDKMKGKGNVNEAIKKLGEPEVAKLIEDHYFEEAKNTLKKTVKLYAKRDKPKVEKKSDMQEALEQLAAGFKKGGKRGSGLAEINIGRNTYQIVGTKLADQRVTPMISEIDAEGNFTDKLIPDTSGDFPLYLQDNEGNLILRNGEPVLNVEGGRVATGLRK
jgi:hypothetical protein